MILTYAPREFIVPDKQTGTPVVVVDTVKVIPTQVKDKASQPPTGSIAGKTPGEIITPVAQAEKKVYVTISGSVIDDAGTPVQTNVEFSYKVNNLNLKDLTPSHADGSYRITLPYSDKYHILVNKESYFLFSDSLQVSKDKPIVRFDITPKKIAVTKVFVFENIMFAFNHSTILPSSYDAVNEIAATLLNNPGLKVQIAGHTCDMGPRDYNQWLSEIRAKSVTDYLISKGIDSSRMTSIGYGLTRPVADNKTADGKRKNRRVEVKVIE